MIYNRNKNCFKKTTVKTEHREAQKNILNLIKQSIIKDSTPKTSNFNPCQQTQNRCKNIQIQEASPPKINTCNFFKNEKPIYESIYSSIDRHMMKTKKQLTINNVFDFTLISSENQSKAKKVQKQYIEMLQTKISDFQIQIKSQKQKIKKLQQQNGSTSSRDYEVQKLIRFYHKSRNVLILQSVELLECKNLFASELKQNQARLKSLNSVMAKGQELLDVYRRNIQISGPRHQTQENIQKMDAEELKDLCKYQQKTIEFLRKQNPMNHQINQIRLLRHQINRVCNENQLLISKLNKKSPQKRQQSPQINKQHFQKSNVQLQNALQQIKKLQKQNLQLAQKFKLEQQKTFKLKQEKQCLGQFLDNARQKTDQLEQVINKNEQQIYHLKSAYINQKKGEQILHFENKDVVTTEQLCRQLKPYPKYFNLLMSIINEYQFKINQLQNCICSEREEKQKFMQWSTEVYQLLESAQIPEYILEKHRQRLYSVDQRMQNSKIQKLLRSICAYSIGVDDKEIRQMQYQLEQYILSLKNRNQVIKQVEFQDGSSVAFSECYTEQDFD